MSNSQNRQILKGYSSLQANSDEWKLIEFKLQLALGNSSVNVKNICNISNTHLSSAFGSYAKGSIILQCFLPTERLNDNNKLSKVCQKGYDLPEIGMMFTVGFNEIKQTKKQFTCIMNKISVGKSYCYSAKKFMENPIQCPEGFDSIYLYNQEETPDKFMHQYIVFKNYQVLPVYVVEYVIDIYKHQQSKTPVCDNCDKTVPELAKFYCQKEDAYFCNECDNKCHDSKLAKTHQRVDVSEKPKKFGYCSSHQLVELQLYCSNCCEPLCVDCKIIGSHMMGEKSKHSLSKLKEAYSEISSKVKEIDPNLERRKSQLTDDLSKIDLKIKQINSKATQIQQALRTIFDKTLRSLKTETQKKLAYLICDQLQLKRQYDHILWMDSFIKYQLEIQEPNEFLNSWYKFSKYKKEVLSLGNLSVNTEVKADMRLEGELRIVVESKNKKGEMTPAALEKEMAANEITPSPQKDVKTAEKDLGSTQLRKTIFKKHYIDKMKEMGEEPAMVKGAMSNMKYDLDKNSAQELN